MAAALQATWDAIFAAHQRYSNQYLTLEDSGRPQVERAADLDALVCELRLFVQQAREELAPWVADPPTETYWAFVLEVSQTMLGSLDHYVEQWGQHAQQYRRHPDPAAPPIPAEDDALQARSEDPADPAPTESVLDAAYGWFEERTRDYPQKIAGYRAQIQAYRAEYRAAAVVDFSRAVRNRRVIRALEETVHMAEDTLRRARRVLRDRTSDQQEAKALAHTPPRRRPLPTGWQVTEGGAS